MGKKKHLKGIDEYDRELIEEALKRKTSSYSNDFVNYNFTVKFKCKTQAQKEFVKLLKNPDKHIVVGSGSAGTGKSFITLATALQMLGKSTEDGKCIKQIIIVVPTVPAGGADQQLGYLKGGLSEKIEPYILSDTETITKILTESGISNAKTLTDGLIRNNLIRYEIVSFVRGKTWDNSIILLNEAEDYAISELYSLITRLGENSKLWVTGDLRQCDRKYIKNSNNKRGGFGYLMDRLKYLEEYGCVEFFPEDIVRNGLITKMIQLWDMPEDEFNALENSHNKKKVKEEQTENIEKEEQTVTDQEPYIEDKPKKRGRPKKVIN